MTARTLPYLPYTVVYLRTLAIPPYTVGNPPYTGRTLPGGYLGCRTPWDIPPYTANLPYTVGYPSVHCQTCRTPWATGAGTNSCATRGVPLDHRGLLTILVNPCSPWLNWPLFLITLVNPCIPWSTGSCTNPCTLVYNGPWWGTPRCTLRTYPLYRTYRTPRVVLPSVYRRSTCRTGRFTGYSGQRRCGYPRLTERTTAWFTDRTPLYVKTGTS